MKFVTNSSFGQILWWPYWKKLAESRVTAGNI